MKTAIISPSGKFYGSEQTLFNFLALTENFDVYIKEEPNGLFDKLKNESYKHSYFLFNNLTVLYFIIALKSVFLYKKIYVNEAGHSKYIIFLAKLLFWKNFYIHVRLTEDVDSSRWQGIGENIILISTSSYIADSILKEINIISPVISSPARGFKSNIGWNLNIDNKTKLNFGVIGRLTATKGILEMDKFLSYLEEKNVDAYVFHFFGDVEATDAQVIKLRDKWQNFKNIRTEFHGFIADKTLIYDAIDVVLHFNKNEPLGVIFLESLNQNVPFIGFDSGGIGVIAKNLGLRNEMVDFKANWCSEFLHKIEKIDIKKYIKAKEIMLTVYSPHEYCRQIENLIK